MATATGSGAKRARDYTRRQSELLEQLESMILRQGFRTITLDEIVAKLGCSRSTLYQIAGSREELILIAIERWHKRVSAKGAELRSRHKNPVELLIAWSDVMRSETADVSLAFLEDQKSTLATRRLLERHEALSVRAVEEILTEGIASGQIRELDPNITAQFFIAMLDRLDSICRDQEIRHTGKRTAEIFGELYRLFIYGIQPTEKSSASRPRFAAEKTARRGGARR